MIKSWKYVCGGVSFLVKLEVFDRQLPKKRDFSTGGFFQAFFYCKLMECFDNGNIDRKRLLILRLLNALILLKNLFWEVTSATQEQYSQATTTIAHLFKTGIYKQSQKLLWKKGVLINVLLEIFF